MLKFISSLLVILLAQTATAKTKPADSCASALLPKVQTFDFALSDLEGSFLALAEKIQAAGEVTPDRLRQYVYEVLSIKVTILNDIPAAMMLLVLESEENKDKKNRAIGSIYQILESMGVPPAIYGLHLDEQSRTISISLPEVPSSPQNEDTAVAHNHIGFLTGKEGSEEDLRDGSRRSIGFIETQVEPYEGPQRQVGHIAIFPAPNQSNVLVIMDQEKNKTYKVDSDIFRAPSAQADGHQYIVNFNTEIAEWVLTDENINNPSGRIGF